MGRAVVRELQEIALLKIDASPMYAQCSRDQRYRMAIDCYTKVFEKHGFLAAKPENQGCAFRSTLSTDKWDFCYVDQSRSGIESGNMDGIIGLLHAGKVINPGAPGTSAAATIAVTDLIPGFHLYRAAHRYEQLELTIRARVAAAVAIRKRFQERLTLLA